MRFAVLIAALLSFARVGVAEDKPATRPTTQPTKIAFVLDASASMQGSFTSTRDELIATIKDLPADQSFMLLIDSDSNIRQYPQFGFAPANAESKKAAERVLNAPNCKPKGEARLKADVIMATKFKPDVIVLVTDGDWAEDTDGKAAAAMITAAVAGKVKINTSLSATGGKTDRQVKLYKLSHATGGVCYDDKKQPVLSTPKAAPVKSFGDGPSIFGEP